MNISTVVTKLQDILFEYGDIEVHYEYDGYWSTPLVEVIDVIDDIEDKNELKKYVCFGPEQYLNDQDYYKKHPKEIE